jgi:hypothetical protein
VRLVSILPAALFTVTALSATILLDQIFGFDLASNLIPTHTFPVGFSFSNSLFRRHATQSQSLTFALSDQTSPNVTSFVSFRTVLGTLKSKELVVQPDVAGVLTHPWGNTMLSNVYVGLSLLGESSRTLRTGDTRRGLRKSIRAPHTRNSCVVGRLQTKSG